MSCPRNTFNEWLQERELVRTSANESRDLTNPVQRKGRRMRWLASEVSRDESPPLLFLLLPLESWAQTDTGGS